MSNIIQFANMKWRADVSNDDEDVLILRAVDSIGKYPWDSGEGNDWGRCDLRRYLNNEFYYSLPKEDRERMIPMRTNTNIRDARSINRNECNFDMVWVDDIYNIDAFDSENNKEYFTWLRNPVSWSLHHSWAVGNDGFPVRFETKNKLAVRPCIMIVDPYREYMDNRVDILSELYNDEFYPLVEEDFENLLIDNDFNLCGSFNQFMFMWYNSDHKNDLERIFEIMATIPLEEFINSWIKKRQELE